MDRGHRPVMAGVHRLEHVEGFGAANLADDDPIGTHPQSVANEFALIDRTGTFDIGWSRFELDDMRLLQPQFDRIFDSDNAFAIVDMARHRVQ